MSPCYIISLCIKGNIFFPAVCYLCVLLVIYVTWKYYQFEFHKCTALKVSKISNDFNWNQSEDDEAWKPESFNMMTRHFVEFVWCFCLKKTWSFYGQSTNMVEYASEMELFMILPTLESCLCWNLTDLITKYWNPTDLITKYKWVKWHRCTAFQIVHISRLNKYY